MEVSRFISSWTLLFAASWADRSPSSHSVDADCNTCPYSADNLYDSNGSWKWFGSVAGCVAPSLSVRHSLTLPSLFRPEHRWQPSEPWNVPYADWTPPAGYTDAQVKLATWWGASTVSRSLSLRLWC